MKAKTIMLLAFLSFVITSVFSFSPVTEVTSNKNSNIAPNPVSMRVHRQADGVMVTWTSSSQAGVAGYEVQRTYFDPNDEYAIWEQVSYSASANARNFKAFDASVYPGYISYRVVSISQDGSRSNSEIVTIRIVSREKY